MFSEFKKKLLTLKKIKFTEIILLEIAQKDKPKMILLLLILLIVIIIFIIF